MGTSQASTPVTLADRKASLAEKTAVRVVPAAIDVVARKSSALRVWLPVIVPPAKTTVEVPGSTVPAVYVQALAVRILLLRVRVPPIFSLFPYTTLFRSVVAAPVNVWGPDPSMRSVAVPPPAVEA